MSKHRKWAGIVGLVVAYLAAAAVLQAQQQPKKIPRLGILFGASAPANLNRMEAFQRGLRELGYVEGKNVLVEQRYADGKLERLPALAAELVALKVDVLVSGAAAPTRALKEASNTIPIVMAQDNDPVANGFVASLARPGSNTTGLSSLAPTLSGKRLEVLKDIISEAFSRGRAFDREKYGKCINEKRNRSRCSGAWASASIFGCTRCQGP